MTYRTDNFDLASRISHRVKLLAIASRGGHWVQLMRLTSAFSNCEVVFVTTDPSYESDVLGEKFHVVSDASLQDKVGLVKLTFQLAWVIWQERPEVVITTGAAPGYLAIRLGRLLGAKTLWLDSLANIDRLSISGERIGQYADMWLTQWPHLARPEGPYYAGSVL
jgi:hypothetical protein